MGTQLSTMNNGQAALMEQVVVDGDLGKLSATQRLDYYRHVCESVGLNPFTKPFDYIRLNGKLTLYARKDATDQLRKIHGVSLSKPDVQYLDDLIVVTIEATDKDGRTDSDVGAVTIANLKGDAKANAIMKAITKAKRRVTLSIAGLGWMDETELETIPAQAVQHVVVDTETGEIVEPAARQLPFDRASGTQTHVNAVVWGLGKGVFNHQKHAENAYKELGKEFGYSGRKATPDETDTFLWAWVAEVESRVKEATRDGNYDNPHVAPLPEDEPGPGDAETVRELQAAGSIPF
jgi:hypothetical protein